MSENSRPWRLTRRQRAALTALHRWLGLGLGLLFVLLGATGSLLVFYVEADRALNPPQRLQATIGQPSSLVRGDNRNAPEPPWTRKPTLKVEPLPILQGENDLLNFGLHVPQRVARVDASDHQGEAKLRGKFRSHFQQDIHSCLR